MNSARTRLTSRVSLVNQLCLFVPHERSRAQSPRARPKASGIRPASHSPNPAGSRGQGKAGFVNGKTAASLLPDAPLESDDTVVAFLDAPGEGRVGGGFGNKDIADLVAKTGPIFGRVGE